MLPVVLPVALPVEVALLVGRAGMGLHVLHLGVGWHRRAGVLRVELLIMACLFVVEVQLGALLVVVVDPLEVLLPVIGTVVAGRLVTLFRMLTGLAVDLVVHDLFVQARARLVLIGGTGMARRLLPRGRMVPRLPLLVTPVFHLLCGTL